MVSRWRGLLGRLTGAAFRWRPAELVRPANNRSSAAGELGKEIIKIVKRKKID